MKKALSLLTLAGLLLALTGGAQRRRPYDRMGRRGRGCR